MSQAEDLLLATVKDGPAHAHRVNDSDTHYVIDPITRRLSNPGSGKTVIMQYDHRSEQFTFEIPRYVDGHDMLLCNVVKVHFINIQDETVQNKGVSDAEGLGLDPNDLSKVLCKWSIPRDATLLAGPLNFIVQYACADDEGNLTYEWHTDINTDNNVNVGINNSEAVVNTYADVLEQWRVELFDSLGGLEQRGQQIRKETEAQMRTYAESMIRAIEYNVAQILEQIPDDYSTTTQKAKYAYDNKAPAIIYNVEGDSIILTDAADHMVKNVRLFGKSEQPHCISENLFDISEYRSSGGPHVFGGDVQYSTVGDDNGGLYGGYVTGFMYSSIETADISESLTVGNVSLLPGTYRLYTPRPYRINDINQIEYERYSTTNEKFGDLFSLVGPTRTIGLGMDSDTDDDPNTLSVTFTIDTTETYACQIHVTAGERYGGTRFFPQLYLIDGQETGLTMRRPMVHVEGPINVEFAGKNLVNLVNSGSAIGVTETVTNGLVSFSGTATGSGGRTAWRRSDVLTLVPGTYYMSLKTTTGKAATPCLTKYNSSDIVAGGEGRFTITETVQVYLGFNYEAGETYTAKNVGVQVELSDERTEYEPYKPICSAPIYSPPMYSATDVPVIRGIPVESGGNYTDSNGQQWVCDEIDLARGVRIQRIGTADLKTHTIASECACVDNNAYSENIIRFDYNNVLGSKLKTPVMSDRFVYKDAHGADLETVRKTEFISTHSMGDTISVFIDRNRLTTPDVTGFRSWLNDHPTEIQFVLETPVETQIDVTDYNSLKLFNTYYPNTIILNDKGAGMGVEYYADIKHYIDTSVLVRVREFVNEWLNEHFLNAGEVPF